MSGFWRRWMTPGEHLGAGGLGEGGELTHGVLGVRRRCPRSTRREHHTLEAQLAVLDLGDVLELGRQAGDPAQRRALLAVELLAVEVSAGAEVRLVAVPGVIVAQRGGFEVEQIRSLSHISLRVAPFVL